MVSEIKGMYLVDEGESLNSIRSALHISYYP